VAEIIRRRLRPAALEFMDTGAIDASRRFLEREMPFPEASAHLIVEVDASPRRRCGRTTRPSASSASPAVRRTCSSPTPGRDGGSLEGAPGGRRSGEIQNRDVAKQDVVVPRMAIPELVARLGGIGARAGSPVICFGHAGDGNVHVNILRAGLDDESCGAPARRCSRR